MSVLDQVMDLKNRGISDQEIIRTLQEQGIPPADISDAFSRAQIKNAVSMSGTEGMEHSILGSEEEPDRLPIEGLEGGTLSDIDLTPPTPGGFVGQVQMPMKVTKEIAGEFEEMYVPQEAGTYYQPQQYPQYQEYAPQEGYQYPVAPGVLDTDTMIEVSEQVFMEKNKPLQKKLDEMNEFRALAQTRLENVLERLRKIEAIIDRLQSSVLEKVGGYGHGLETVRKEMSMMQDSFSKMVNQTAEKSEEKHHHQSHPQHHQQQHQQHQQSHSQHSQHKEHPQHHASHHEHHVTIHKSRKVTRRHSGKK